MSRFTNRHSYTEHSWKPYIQKYSFPVEQNTNPFISNPRTIVSTNNPGTNKIMPHNNFNCNSNINNVPAINDFYLRIQGIN